MVDVSFPKLGITIPVSDTAFTVFGIEVKWYGLLITLGIILAMVYAFTQMKKYGVDPDRAIDAVIAGIIGAVIGARAYYVIMEWDTYAGDWKSIFNIRNGGLAIYGGIIGAILVGGITAKLRKLRLMPLLDIVGIGFLLGQGIGRWGNFTNQEAFGYNTESLFGMTSSKISNTILSAVSNPNIPADIASLDPNKPVHPCFLYESLWCLLGFLLFALFAKKIRKFDGQIFLMYLIWYGTERFFVEGLRTDSLMIGSIRASQALSAILVIASIIILIVMLFRVRRMGDDYVLYVNTEESKEIIRQSEERRSKKENTDTVEENDTETSDDVKDESPETADENKDKLDDTENSDNKDNKEKSEQEEK